MSYILVMFIYAGVLANGDSVTLHSISGFKTEQACIAAGRLGDRFVSGTTKAYVFTCMRQ